jgi:hypothetical protein
MIMLFTFHRDPRPFQVQDINVCRMYVRVLGDEMGSKVKSEKRRVEDVRRGLGKDWVGNKKYKP